MKIIHLLLGKANPSRMNGVNNVVHSLASEQVRQGLSVEVWGITKNISELGYRPSFPLRLFPAVEKWFFLSPELELAFSEVKDAVFHLHGGFINEMYLVSQCLKERSIPFVFTPHGTYMKGAIAKSNSFLKNVYFSLREKKLLKNASKVHFLGESESDTISKEWLKNKIEIIPNGCISMEEIINEPKERKSIRFGFCGRLDNYHKGLDLLFDAFQNYLFKGGEGTLELIGDGPDRFKLLKRAKEGKYDKRIVFHGKVFGRTKEILINSFDVFVHTSRHEGMPVAVLEAAQLGVPAIVSKETNLSSYYNEYNAGYVLKENNIDYIEKAMNESLIDYRSGELGNKSKASLRMSRENFTWPEIVKRFQNCYESIMVA